MSEDRDRRQSAAEAPIPAVARVAELASKLAAIDPTAKETVRELFKAFAEVQEHYRQPEPIDTAPRATGVAIFLFCPEQRGWQVGTWQPGDPGRWLSTLEPAIELRPSHWMRSAAEPAGAPPRPEPEAA